MQRSSMQFARVISTVAVVLFCIGVAGCLAFPTKMTMSRHGSGGLKLQNSDVDTTFIKAGVTTRSEIATRLGAIDVNSPAAFFWGRWVESSWGVVGGSLPLSSSESPVAGSMRHWRYRNILIQFNDQGIAAEQHSIDKEDAVWHQLLEYVRTSRVPWPSETLQIPSTEKKNMYAILTADGIQLKSASEKDSVTFALSSPVTIRLRSRFWPQALSTPELTCFELYIERPGGVRKRNFESCVSARQFLGILAYLDHLQPPAKWEGKP